MDTQSASRASMYRTDEWQSLAGEIVEVRAGGKVYRKGLVDDTMPDASGLWIALEGAAQREFIDAASGFEVWTSVYPRSRWGGTAAFQMGAEPAEVREQNAPAQETPGGRLRR